MILLTKEITGFEPEVSKNLWDFSVAEWSLLEPRGIDEFLLVISNTHEIILS